MINLSIIWWLKVSVVLVLAGVALLTIFVIFIIILCILFPPKTWDGSDPIVNPYDIEEEEDESEYWSNLQ